MFYYTISAGNPEGTDFTISLFNSKQIADEEFQVMCEEAFVYALEKQYDKKKYVFVSSMDLDSISDYMGKFGFEPADVTSSYYLEPYFNLESIKSDKLKQWMSRDSGEDEPEYRKHELC